MPRIKYVQTHDEFQKLNDTTRMFGENNDCAVKAICAATGVPYETVQAQLKTLGRKDRRGTQGWMTEKVMNQLGFKLTLVNRMEKIQQYPGVHGKVLRSVTTHHPDRFQQVWRDGKTYLFNTPGHILCVKDGRNLDWTRGKAKRVTMIREVTPL